MKLGAEEAFTLPVPQNKRIAIPVDINKPSTPIICWVRMPRFTVGLYENFCMDLQVQSIRDNGYGKFKMSFQSTPPIFDNASIKVGGFGTQWYP